MKPYSFAVYLLVMALVTYLIRALPLILVKKSINDRFLLSFLHYVPTAVLSVMTVPACLLATRHLTAGILAFAAALLLALRRKGLLTVAAGACIAVFLTEAAILLWPTLAFLP